MSVCQECKKAYQKTSVKTTAEVNGKPYLFYTSICPHCGHENLVQEMTVKGQSIKTVF